MAIGGVIKGAKKLIPGMAKPKASILDELLDESEVVVKADPFAPQDPKSVMDEILDAEIEEINLADTPLPQEPKSVLDEILDSFDEDVSLEQEPADFDEFTWPDKDELTKVLTDMDIEGKKEEGIEWIKQFDNIFLENLTEDDLEVLGPDWPAMLKFLVDKDTISEFQAEQWIHATLKKQAGIELEDEEVAAWDKITDYFEGITDDVLIAPVGEEFDMGKQFISIHNQNAPGSFDDIVTRYAGPESWVHDLSPDEMDAMTAMTHIRGGNFPNTTRGPLTDINYNSLKAEYPPKDVVDSLSEMDWHAINFYTRRGDGPMNEALRNPEALEPDSHLAKAIEATTRALDKLPSWDPSKGMLYRSINDPDVVELYRQMPDGQEYTEMAFKSTSHKPMVGEDLKPTGTIEAANRLVLVVKPKEGGNGKAIEGLSDFYPEKEVLYKPGTKFRIMRKVAREDGKLVVFVEEL